MRYDKVEFNSKSRRLLPPLTRSPSLSEGGFYGGIDKLADTTKVCADLSVCKAYDFQIITFKNFSTKFIFAFVLQRHRAKPIPLRLRASKGSLREGAGAVGD